MAPAHAKRPAYFRSEEMLVARCPRDPSPPPARPHPVAYNCAGDPSRVREQHAPIRDVPYAMCAVVAVRLRRFSRALSACGMRAILPPLHDLRGGIRHVASLKHCRVVCAHWGCRCAVDSLVGKTAVVKTHGEPGTRESAMRDVRSIAPELLSCRLGIPRGVFRGTTDRNVHKCTHLMQAQVVRKFSGNGDLTFTRETSVGTFGGLRSRDHPSTRRDVPCLIGQERPHGHAHCAPSPEPVQVWQ